MTILRGNSFVDKVWLYLGLQNTQHLQGIRISKFALDDVCPECKKGKLCTRLGGVLEMGKHKLIDQQFECDSCGKLKISYRFQQT